MNPLSSSLAKCSLVRGKFIIVDEGYNKKQSFIIISEVSGKLTNDHVGVIVPLRLEGRGAWVHAVPPIYFPLVSTFTSGTLGVVMAQCLLQSTSSHVEQTPGHVTDRGIHFLI